MAELISIDLVLSALTTAYNFCQDVRHAPGLIQKARKDASKTMKQVKLLKKRMNNRASLLGRTETGIKEMLNDDFNEIVKHSNKAKDLAEEWGQINRWELGSKSIYVARHKSTFEEISEGLSECRKSIHHVITIFAHTDGLEEILKKQDQMLKTLQGMRSTRKTTAEKCHKVQNWAEQNSRRITDAAIHPDENIKQQLTQQLVGVGMPKDEAAAKVGELLKTIRKERNRSMSFHTKATAGMEQPHGKKKPPGNKADGGGKKEAQNGKKVDEVKNDKGETPPAQPKKEDSNAASKTIKKEGGGQKTNGNGKAKSDLAQKSDKKQDKQGSRESISVTELETKSKPPPSEAETSKSEAAGKQSGKKNVQFSESQHPSTEAYRILFVDRSNGARSVMSHLYMELVRSWTMNTHKRWLFDQVNSAGLDIPTPFNKSVANPVKVIKSPGAKAIATMAGDDQHFWSKDPDEKDFIVKRLSDRHSRGIYATDFTLYKYILCFDERSLKEVESLKAASEIANKGNKPTATIQLLKRCGMSSAWQNNEEQLAKLRGKIKVAVKGFLTAELGWTRPLEGIAGGKWRTLQFLAPPKDTSKVTANKDALKRADKMGCKVNVVSEFADRPWLVSISGPRAKLEEARKSLFENAS